MDIFFKKNRKWTLRVPHSRPSHTISGTRTTIWEPLVCANRIQRITINKKLSKSLNT